MNADFHVTGHGGLYLVQPLTEAASLWLEEHIGEEAQWFGSALAVEHRYIRPLVEGIVNDGYAVI